MGLEQCESKWGQAALTGYNELSGLNFYNFVASPNLIAQVYPLNGVVQSIDYCSLDKATLLQAAKSILQANNPGIWKSIPPRIQYSKEWIIKNEYGDLIAYALFAKTPDDQGGYRLQVSSAMYGNYLTGYNQQRRQDVHPQQEEPVPNVNKLNI